MKKLFIIIVLCLFAVRLEAASTTHCDGTQADCQSKVTAASAGDTVIIDTSGTWSSPVSVTKGITITGPACTLGTVEGMPNLPTACPVTITSSNSTLFTLTGDEGTFKISNLGLSGTNTGGSYIISNGNFTYIIIDHLLATPAAVRAFVFAGGPPSYWYLFNSAATMPIKYLIHHVNYTATTNEGVLILVRGRAQDWMEPDDYNSDNFIFIEDSRINYTAGGFASATDSDYGPARYHIRHNLFNNTAPSMHDAGNSIRGQRLAVIHDNTIVCTSGKDCTSTYPLALRGGTGLFYNNTITGSWLTFGEEIFRTGGDNSGAGLCGAGNKVCSDTDFGIVYHCASAPHQACAYLGTNVCGSGNNCVATCTQDSDCASGQACVNMDGTGTGGYPCRDQNGWGQDNPTTHQNTLDPFFVWGNTVNGDALNATSGGYSQIAENRDFCNHNTSTACNGVTVSYTGYAYPHTLQGGEPPADITAPENAITTGNSTITTDAKTVTGTASDAVGVSGVKFRIGSEPDVTHGTACTGTTSWSCSTSGYASGANTLYIEAYDAAGNYSSGNSITVTYNPPASTVQNTGSSTGRNQ